MKKTILEIYALLVCFIATISIAIALGIAAWNMIGIVSPEFTLRGYMWESFQSDKLYEQSLIRQSQYSVQAKTYTPPMGEALSSLRKENYAQAIQMEKRDSIHWLVQSLIILIICSTVFVTHWKLASHIRKQSNHSNKT